MNYRDWFVGMRVVCLTDLSRHYVLDDYPVSVPARDGVYTIRSVFVEPLFRDPAMVFVRLIEVINVPSETEFGPYEAGFAASHFRPLEIRKTDISLFTSMLTGAKERERA